MENQHLDTSVFGRVLAEDVKVERKKIAVAGRRSSTTRWARRFVEAGVDDGPRPFGPHVRGASTACAASATGGRSRPAGSWTSARRSGIIAAQSIGEPGTQLTMRTFHTGGVAGEDITHGLPRVVELFEARRPKGEALITELSGTVQIEDDEEKKERRITVTVGGRRPGPVQGLASGLGCSSATATPSTSVSSSPRGP